MTKSKPTSTYLPRLILASQSIQRQDMLATLGLPFEVMPADLDELAITAPTHFERAAKIAGAKASAIAESLTSEQVEGSASQEFVILAADTYLIDETTQKALEKPANVAQARELLNYQSGKTLTELTGVAFYHSKGGELKTKTASTKVKFRQLSSEEIERYIKTQPVTTWSGAFCPAYTAGAALIDSIEGSLTCFTHGFPMEFFVPELKRVGFAI